MESQKVKVIALPITRYSHTRLRKPLEVDESRRRREIRRGAKVPRREVRKKKERKREREKKDRGSKGGTNARRNKKTEECGRAFAYCYVNARAK